MCCSLAVWLWVGWFVGGFDRAIVFVAPGDARPLLMSPCNTLTSEALARSAMRSRSAPALQLQTLATSRKLPYFPEVVNTVLDRSTVPCEPRLRLSQPLRAAAGSCRCFLCIWVWWYSSMEKIHEARHHRGNNTNSHQQRIQGMNARNNAALATPGQTMPYPQRRSSQPTSCCPNQ